MVVVLFKRKRCLLYLKQNVHTGYCVYYTPVRMTRCLLSNLPVKIHETPRPRPAKERTGSSIAK